MTTESRQIRVTEDSPDRCRYPVATGQCPYMKVHGDYCPMHSRMPKREDKSNLLYQIAIGHDKFANHAKAKTLTEEVAILRTVLQMLINTADGNTTQLLALAPQITPLVANVRDTVNAMERLDRFSGQMLDRTALAQFSDCIINIITPYISDEDLPFVADAIAQAAEDAVSANTVKVNDPISSSNNVV